MQTPAPLPQPAIDGIVRQALAEDAPSSDLTHQILPAATRVKASLVAREHGILAGVQLFTAALHLTDPTVRIETQHDAQPFFPGDILATAEGPARAILHAERVALNFTQRLSGIATLTAMFVEQVKGTSARIVSTPETTPTLRLFEHYAVRCGGGDNHSDSLANTTLINAHHLAILCQSDLTQTLGQARANLPPNTSFTVQINTPDQIEPVLAAGADTVLLTNFTPIQLRAAVGEIAGRALVQAIGEVRLDTVRAIAETGVDLISVSALTHSAHPVDLALNILPYN